MSKKIIIILSIIIALVVSGSMVYINFIDGNRLSDWLSKLTGEMPNQGNTADEIVGENASTTAGPEVKKIKIETNNEIKKEEPSSAAAAAREVNKEDLQRIAAAFAERFGSYSNQSNYSNINDLKIFMSQKMSAWAQNFVNQQRQTGSAENIYYGITTKAISQEVKEFDEDEGRASILVGTRRREATSSTDNVSNFFNQNILINLIKENGIWKVDSANWQL